MMYDSDTFIKNIIEHSERIAAIIEATDFNNHSLNPNITLIPSLWNNVNDALTVWAMNIQPIYEDECRKRAEMILRKAGELNVEAENCLTTMKNLRTIYTADFPEMEFNQNDCMVFLNAYDNFMYIFYTSCNRVQKKMEFLRTDYKKICTMRETFLKNISGDQAPDGTALPAQKSAADTVLPDAQTDDIAELLRQLIGETKKTNDLLTKLSDKIR